VRTWAKIVVSWVACVIVSAVLANMIVRAIDREARDRYGADEHRCMKAEDISIRCAMRIHALEQRIDMHELRLEEMERMVFGTNFTKEVNND
jgi:hypothetical protein